MAGWQQDPRYQPPQHAWPPRQQPPPQPQYPVQRYQPQQWQQPRMAVTWKPISFFEHCVHFVLSCCTFGLWIPIWIARAAGKRKEKTYYQ